VARQQPTTGNRPRRRSASAGDAGLAVRRRSGRSRCRRFCRWPARPSRRTTRPSLQSSWWCARRSSRCAALAAGRASGRAGKCGWCTGGAKQRGNRQAGGNGRHPDRRCCRQRTAGWRLGESIDRGDGADDRCGGPTPGAGRVRLASDDIAARQRAGRWLADRWRGDRRDVERGASRWRRADGFGDG
jgi:hypothetical protein